MLCSPKVEISVVHNHHFPTCTIMVSGRTFTRVPNSGFRMCSRGWRDLEGFGANSQLAVVGFRVKDVSPHSHGSSIMQDPSYPPRLGTRKAGTLTWHWLQDTVCAIVSAILLFHKEYRYFYPVLSVPMHYVFKPLLDLLLHGN